MNIVEVHNLRKTYGEQVVLRGVTFAVKAGEIYSLLGQNGAGKTTTLDIIEGLQHSDDGTVCLFGLDIRAQARQIQRQLGVQLQATALMADMTTNISVLEQVQMFARLYQRRMNGRQAHDFLKRFQLADKAKANPAKLSGGEKQRLALALALVNEPRLVILDEPTAGLDVQSRRLLWQVIREWHTPERAIILTTHNIEEAEKLADRVGILHEGVIAATGTPHALIAQIDADSSITIDGDVSAALLQGLTSAARVLVQAEFKKIYTRDLSRTMVELITAVDHSAVNLGNIRIQHPSLEDVFLSVTGHALPTAEVL